MGSLKSVYTGFAAFERQLLKMKHTGWVHYKPSTGELVLLKSPYRATPLDNCNAYAVPADLRPMENELVTLEVEGPVRQLKERMNNSCFYNYRDWYKVVGVTRLNINDVAVMQKPYLDANEFRYRLSQNWKNAAQDNLDFSLALQLLSCPESLYGKGGIGTWSLAGIGTTKSPLIDLMRTISHMIPTEFLIGTNRYQYNFIGDIKAQRVVERNRKKSNISEISYNYIQNLPEKSANTPVQIPTYIYNSEFIPGTLELDQDILEYLLTALLIKPPIKDYMISKIEETVREVNDKTRNDEDFVGMNIDLLSPPKIASAICRLDLRNNMDEESFNRHVSQYDEIMYNFIEFKKDVVDLNPNRETWTVPSARVSYQDKKMEPIDYLILHVMRKIEEDQGKSWVNLNDIEQHSEFDPKLRGDWKIKDSLIRLNNLGKIIKSPKGLGYRRLKFD